MRDFGLLESGCEDKNRLSPVRFLITFLLCRPSCQIWKDVILNLSI